MREHKEELLAESVRRISNTAKNSYGMDKYQEIRFKLLQCIAMKAQPKLSLLHAIRLISCMKLSVVSLRPISPGLSSVLKVEENGAHFSS